MLDRADWSRVRHLAVVAGFLCLLAARSAPAQYAVGTGEATFNDPARGDRAITCDLYYPAVSAGPDQPVAEPPSVGFASVAFGHGYQIATGNYAWVAEKLAASGCVVALPRTGGELFPDHEDFGLDLARVARALRDANDDPDSPFYTRMGPRTLVMGHSMGGGCTILAAASDPTLTAVANLAAAETDPSAIAACGQLDRPVLMFCGTNDCVTPPADHQIPMFDALAGGWRTRLTITGASHCQFNSTSLLCALGEFCSPDISRQEQQDLVWTLLEPWLSAVLFQDQAAGGEFQTRLDGGAGFTYEQAGNLTAVPVIRDEAVTRFEAYPNPFNPSVTLQVVVVRPGGFRLSIRDVRGRQLRLLAARSLPAGPHEFRWDGRDDAGRSLPSGVYLAHLDGPAEAYSRRILLLR